MKWSVRELFNPVITRVLLFGANPFDNEYVIQQMEQVKILSGKAIKSVWINEWTKKAEKYIKLADEAIEKNNRQSAKDYYMFATRCFYACYMINSDDIEMKREVYKKLETYYKKTLDCRETKYVSVLMPTEFGEVPGYLLLPDENKFKSPYPCTMIYSGIGSCKEELDMLATPMLKRGIAALICDQPGTGAALFDHNLHCNGYEIEAAMNAMTDYLTQNKDIDENRLCSFGLCMGGGYSAHAASLYPKMKCCVSLFPLFVNVSKLDSIPLWMKTGKWSNFQYGNDGSVENFLDNMTVLSKGDIPCDYYLVYSPDDNWMTIDASMNIFEKAKGHKEKLYLDDKPSFASEETIMHAMPVGEQLHWVKILAADWVAERI